MKVLVVTQYYWPEPFNTTEICEELAARGHEVTVLTGLPNYPEGEIYPGYEGKKRREESRGGVRIVRSWLWPRKRDALNRFLNYESFSFAASQASKKLDKDFDVVLSCEISPIMSANPAIAYARSAGTPLLLYVIDIWPECLLAGGISKHSAIYRYYGKVSERIYNAADRIAVTSPLFKGYISKLTGKQLDAVYLPQFAEDIFEGSDITRPEGYSERHINLTFAGNIGAAQSVQTIVRAAALLKEEDILFHIVGSGSELEACKKLADELRVTGIVFHGRHPLEEMPGYYAASDAMLATFANNPTLGFTLPRKIQSYMAAGKPVLGTLVGESRRVVEEAGCGLCCEAEDYKALASICRRFASLGQKIRNDYGKRALDYYRSHYSREGFFKTLEEELYRLKGTRHAQ